MRRYNILVIILLILLVSISCNKTEVKDERNINSQSENKSSYLIKTQNYSIQDVSINFPQIIGLKDNSKQTQINDLLKNEALSIVENVYGDPEDVTIKIDYKVMMQTKNLLSIQYSGFGYSNGASYPTDYLYTINIDLEKVIKLRLSDLVKVDAGFVRKFRQYKVEKSPENEIKAVAFKYIIESHTDADLITSFKRADSSYLNGGTFSYLTNDSLGISMEVPHVSGDHVEIELKYQDIKEYLSEEFKLY
jgi:hypothetical protein